MDSMNHHDNPAHAFDENRRRHIWSEHISAPSSLMSRIFEHVELGQEQDVPMRVDELVSALHHPAWSMRVAAVQALARLGERTLLGPIQEALYDEHVSVRAAAVSAMGQLGARTSIPMLEQFLHDSEWQVREKAVLALATLGAQSSINLLNAALYDPDSTVREAVVYALQHLQASVPLTAEEIPSVVQIVPEEQASIPDKTNILKPFLSHLKSPFHRGQRSSGATIMSNGNGSANIIHENYSLYNVAERSRGRKQYAFTTGIALFVVIALVVTWAIIVPLQHLSSTRTGNHPNPIIGATATPSPTQASLGPAGTTLYTYQSSYRSVFSVSWSPDDKRVVATDNTIQSWDATTGKNVVTYAKQMSGDVYSVAWSPDGKFIAGSGLQIQLWNAVTGESLGTYQPKSYRVIPGISDDVVSDSAWSPDSKLIASAVNGQTYGHSIQVWNPQTKQMIFSIPSNPPGYIMNVGWSPDGKYLAFDAGGKINVYNVATRALVSQNVGGIFAWSQDSTKIVTTSQSEILIWDVATDKTLTSIQYQDPSHGLIGPTAIAWSPDGKNVAVVAGAITEWDVNTKSKVLDYPGHPLNPGNYMLSLAWSHNGSMIASCNGGEVGPGAAQIWVP